MRGVLEGNFEDGLWIAFSGVRRYMISFRYNEPAAANKGYGIVKWTGGRRTKLVEWCASNGYDHTTLLGQFMFLTYELKGSYKSTYIHLLNVENSAEGAYDAGYYFGYYFERPGNRQVSSVNRGNIARDTYWPKYS